MTTIDVDLSRALDPSGSRSIDGTVLARTRWAVPAWGQGEASSVATTETAEWRLEGGSGQLQADPTPLTNALVIEFTGPGLERPLSVCVAVPDEVEPVALTSLVQLDPSTLEPGAVPEAAWWAVAGGLEGAYDETLAARDAAVVARDAAEAVAAEAAATVEGKQDVATLPEAVAAALSVPVVADELSAKIGEAIVPVRNSITARGKIAIELDDALAVHFSDVLPISVELGFPIGTAWPTGNGNDALVADAYAKGWEIQAHGHNHENHATSTAAQIETYCQQSVAAISAITGRSDNISFVYPQHQRTNTSDRVCAKYFTRGRGRANVSMQGRSMPNKWLVDATQFDTEMDVAGNLNKRIIDMLAAIAASDSKMLFYFHYTGASQANKLVALRQLVNACRQFNIEIVKPSDIYGTTQAGLDPYIDETARYTLAGGRLSFSTEQAYKGANSIKFTPDPAVASHGQARWTTPAPAPVREGMFAVMRASFRYESAGDISVTGVNQGINFAVSGTRRMITTAPDASTAKAQVGARLPVVGSGSTIIPAGDWQKVSRPIILPPQLSTYFLWLDWTNIAAAQPEMYVDELRADLVDYVSALTYEVTLNGTTGVTLDTGLYSVLPASYGVSLSPRAAVAGRLYYEMFAGRLTVKSTDAADTTQTVSVVITPGPSYADYVFEETGA